MKNVKKILCFVFIVVAAIFLNNANSYAAEIQYTDNVIPIMTSDTTPTGKASSSSVWVSSGSGGSYPAWKAFDYNTSTTFSGWITQHGTTQGWLSYEFPDAKCITKYTIISRNPVDFTIQITELPKSWTFEAWDENSNKWVVLDTQSNVTNWTFNVKKDFTFSNTNLYKKYRINITENCGLSFYTAIGELEMMEIVSPTTNLKAVAGNTRVDLTWDGITNVNSYKVKRSITPNGPYTTIATTSVNTYTDTGVTNGTTYYYVVSAIVSGVESPNSNEVTATPKTETGFEGNKAILEIVMTNGTIKEYDLTATELEDFLTWYDNRSNGTGKSYYRITKRSNVKPFISRKEFLSYDKIYSFEVKDYNE